MHIHARDKSPSLDFRFIIEYPRAIYAWLYVPLSWLLPAWLLPLSFLSIPFFGGIWISTHMNKNL